MSVGMQSQWDSFLKQGIPSQAASVMLMAKRSSTQKQYDSYLKLWLKFCSEHSEDPFAHNIPLAITFLEQLRQQHQLGYSALNTARSALSSIVIPLNDIPLGQQRLVKLYMRGAFNIRPPLPRYHDTWDPQIILTLLKTWAPASTVSLKLLSFKVVILVLLVTGQRIQTLSLLSLDAMSIDSNTETITFRILDLIKQSRPGFKNPLVVLRRFPLDVDLCIVTYLLAYVQRTSSVRTSQTLFLSFQKPHQPVTKSTLARWVKHVMKLAKIDVQVFKPHSIRSASTSAALRGGAQMEDILASAGWSNDSVFGKYYNRPLTTSIFDVAVLHNTRS